MWREQGFQVPLSCSQGVRARVIQRVTDKMETCIQAFTLMIGSQSQEKEHCFADKDTNLDHEVTARRASENIQGTAPQTLKFPPLEQEEHPPSVTGSSVSTINIIYRKAWLPERGLVRGRVGKPDPGESPQLLYIADNPSSSLPPP